MAIKCCHGCVPPKRHPACHGHCPEYLSEKEQDDKEKAEVRKQKEITGGIYYERAYKVAKAKRKHGRV